MKTRLGADCGSDHELLVAKFRDKWKKVGKTTRAFKEERKKVKLLSCVQLFATSWTVAYQAPPSMEFCRQEYWSGLPFPSPGDLPDPGTEPLSSALQADTLPSEPPGKPQTIQV